MPGVVRMLDPWGARPGPPSQEPALFRVAIQSVVEVVFVVADVGEAGVQVRGSRGAVLPRAVHHPKVAVAQRLHVRGGRTFVGGCPMVFHTHQDAVAFRNGVASHTHVHPRHAGEAGGLGDGEGVVQAALVQPAVGVEPQQHVGLFMPKRDLVKLSTDPGVHKRGVPVGVPDGEVQGLVVVKPGAGAELLVQVKGGGEASVVWRRGDAVHDPRAEPRLQDLGVEKGRQILATRFFKQHLEIGDVHVAVEPCGDDVLHGLAVQGIAEVGTQVVQDACPFVIRVPAVDLGVRHGRQGVESLVLDVAFFQDKLLVVLHHVHKRLVAVFPLHKEVAAVLRRPFLQPHVVVDGRGHQIAPPVVPQFVREEVSVGEEPLLNHGPGVGDVGGNLQGAVRGEHVADALPGVRTPPVLAGVDGVGEFREFGLHEVGVAGLGREADRDVAVRPGVHVVVVHVRAHRDGAQVGGNGVVQGPGGAQRVAAQLDLFHEVALVVGASAVGALDVVGVGGAFHEVVEARVPHPAVVGWDGREPNAQVVDQIAGVVHPAPVRVVARLSAVPHVQGHGVARSHGFRRVNVQLVAPSGEPNRAAVPRQAVHLQRGHQVPPHAGAAVLQHGEVDGGVGVQVLSGVVCDVQEELVVLDVEAVASGDARPHVVILGQRKHLGAWTGLVAAHVGVAPLDEEGLPPLGVHVVESGEGLVLGQHRACERPEGQRSQQRFPVHASKLAVLSHHERSAARRSGGSGLHLAGRRPRRGRARVVQRGNPLRVHRGPGGSA